MNSVELFSGVGGLALGVSMAGFKHKAVIESDSDCCNTIRANQKSGPSLVSPWPLHQSDVRQFDFSSLNLQPDLLTGGPPCQPFSLGGKCKGHKDKRDMFPEAIRAVRELRPKTFILENVKGLTRSAFINYFEYIRLQLTFPSIEKRFGERWFDHQKRLERHFSNGRHPPEYRVMIHSLNTADYGVPQKRERIVLVGLLGDLNLDWSFPTPTHSSYALLRSKWGTGIYWERHRIAKKSRPQAPVGTANLLARQTEIEHIPVSLPWVTVRDTIWDLPHPTKSTVESNLNHTFIAGARSYRGHTGSPIDEPAKALKAGSHGVPGGENMVHFTNGQIRYFTVRECARLQCFPDSYIFPGNWTSNTRQLGNAVPVSLAHLLAESLKQTLNSKS